METTNDKGYVALHARDYSLKKKSKKKKKVLVFKTDSWDKGSSETKTNPTRPAMAKLTPANIFATIKSDKRIDQNVEFDGEGERAMIWLNEGWTWNALDGNRSAEAFILSTNEWEPADTVAFLKSRIKNIEPIK